METYSSVSVYNLANYTEYLRTTAGWKNSFAYDKLIQTLIQQITDPSEAIVLGGTWRIPVMEKLLSQTFIRDLKLDGTYNEASFAREYESEWSGDAENAFFSAEVFDKHRVLLQPEVKRNERVNSKVYYILGVDVGRKGCSTEICVFKVAPQVDGAAIKSLVNLYSYDEEHFETQAIKIKNLFFQYGARAIAIDGNGLGIGLIDYMVKSQQNTDPNSDYDILPPFGVTNDAEGFYKQYRTPEMMQAHTQDAMYIIKANAPVNSEAYTYVQTQLSSGKIKFLIDEQTAKVKLLSTKVGQQMSPDQRAERMRPFTYTTILREQMLNLVEEHEGYNIILKQSSHGIKKDKFSAFLYGLYYIKQEENRRTQRRGRDLSKLMLFN
ncbi:MAG: hypothetical protein LUC37_02825 [Prevotella sp.]|nr:hypothetical protein [Prevotella sp.]